MNLTEILLSLAIVLGVIAGIAVNYANVKERSEEQQVMQGLEMLRSNVEQIYGHGSHNGLTNSLLLSAGAVPQSLVRGGEIKTPWGAVTVSSDDEATYKIVLDDLPASACRSMATLSTRSWDQVLVGDSAIFTRTDDTDVQGSAIASACTGSANKVTFVGP